MKVRVYPQFVNGRLIRRSKDDVKLAPSEGTFKLYDNRDHFLLRVVRVAQLTRDAGGKEEEVLPGLVDAEVIHCDGKQLIVRGQEKVGDIYYSQTWNVKVISC